MKTKKLVSSALCLVLSAKKMLAVALCAVGLAAFAAEPDAVQLWENGPYFATCNVGAEASEGYGDLIKYDDAQAAVTAKLGSEWRLPTTNELWGLCRNCNYVRTNNFNNTSITGGIFSCKSDPSKFIFIPAAGFDKGSGRIGDGVGSYIWTSTTREDGSICYFVLEDGPSWLGKDSSYGMSVRAVKDPPPEISAVSAEGTLDLTVGDRVAQDEETLVVDPAWGKAETATVKLQNGWTRTYTCASNDLWDTTALTPGRHGLALRAGEGETGVLYGAFFWKTGADWEVLDLPPYSTEGIEFQADKTYLVLGQYEFAPDKPLTVLDGAKFEYGEGAGFKGGKLDLPKRYGTNVVEGGLYQIVEKIKGCADNPWVVGDDGEEPPQLVEAYTNGNELVVQGKGTVLDLSEIPAAVKDGITAITVAEPTVGVLTDALRGIGASGGTIALTLPDGWQGELPKGGSWYGATGVELTRMPMAVKNVKPQQRYPWNGLVDVNFDLMGEGSVKVKVQVTVDGKKLKKPTVTGETKFDLGAGGEQKGLKLTWNANADFGDAEKHEKIKVKLTVEKAEVD